jgi:hypothetical protein
MLVGLGRGFSVKLYHEDASSVSSGNECGFHDLLKISTTVLGLLQS